MSTSKLYNTARWKKFRKIFLSSHPYCQCDHHKGKGIRADDPRFGGVPVVDHIEPHRGDERKFWSGPFQSMCKQCHDRYAQSRDKGGAGFLKGCDSDGIPLSNKHHWNEA